MVVSISKKFKFYSYSKLIIYSTPPTGLDTWGLDPIDYRLNQDLHLIRRYPSPLTNYGLGSRLQKQKKVINKKKRILKKMIILLVIHCGTPFEQSWYSTYK
jgi:hypothetical protein